MQEYEIELSIGDVLQIGDCSVTIIDIEGPQVSFRVDRDEAGEPAAERLEELVRQPR